jgi:S1-C subfamily serine protease
MKKIILVALFISLTISQISFAQTYNNPKCENQSNKNVKILKVIRSDNSTKIFFEYIRTENTPYCIFLSPPNTLGAYYISWHDKIYKLLSTSGIGNVDGITNTPKNIPIHFSATFEAIPKFVVLFDLIEGSTGSWMFYGVELINGNQSAESYVNDDCDNVKTIPASVKPTFESMLSGVKHATILKTSSQNINGLTPVFNALSQYLREMGFEVDTEFLDESDKSIKLDRSSDNVFVYVICNFYISPNNYAFEYSNFEWVFASSINSEFKWSFYDNKTTSIRLERGIESVQPYIYKVFRNMYQYRKPNYDPANKIRLAKQITCWTESKIKDIFNTKGLDLIEGIYENSNYSSDDDKSRVGIIKINGEYKLIYLSGASNQELWDEGEIKASLKPTATELFFKADWTLSNKVIDENFYISFDNGFFTVTGPDKLKDVYVKMFPAANYNNRNVSPNVVMSSGSGFAISSNGYIITNHHVVDGATNISVRGINGNFEKKYSAKVIVDDTNNDLCIIKIEDSKFTTLGVIPYVISSKSSDVGSSVFVLGYPLRAKMGEEVKVTNGIISSKSGYQGDVSSYQISVPIQPGNSGGPLFNYSGNLIGVVNAKLVGAENATYAIKSQNILNLIDLLITPPQLQTNNMIIGLSLPEQIKKIKKFTYIIEVN